MIYRIFFALLIFVSITTYATDNDEYNAHTIRLSDIPKNGPRFESYPATGKFNGRLTPPDVQSEKLARMFRTRIREGAQNGPNFAGHYTIVSWGCGMDCSAFAIVDAHTGKVYFPTNFYSVEGTNVAYEELESKGLDLVQYKISSRLLIVIGSINENSALRGVSYFLWEHNHLRRIHFVHKPYE